MSLAFLQKKNTRTELHELIARLAFVQKKITLSSGRTSDFYFNMKPLVMHPHAAPLVAAALSERLQPFSPDYVGGLELGAVPLAALVVAHSQNVCGFFVRKKPKKHGLQLAIEGLEQGQSMRGKKVAILDDVTTSGASVLNAARAAKEQGGHIVGVFAIVDREEGARKTIEKEGFVFHTLYNRQRIHFSISSKISSVTLWHRFAERFSSKLLRNPPSPKTLVLKAAPTWMQGVKTS